MKKRIITALLIIVCLLMITGCNQAKEYTASFDPDGGRVNGATTYELKYKSGEGIDQLPKATKAGYTFLGWYLDDELVTSIDKSTNKDVTLIAKWEEYEFITPVTDRVKLTTDYEGKDFYEDGIGVVTVQQYVDGDTTIFKSGNRTITIRYEGIDTPESTYRVDPWGFSASEHTKETLKNAKTIVLQTENGKPGKDNADTTGNRFLAWVWADGRLLNLELAELGLANGKASGTSHSNDFIEAIKPLVDAKVRIYGQEDPKYDYSKTYQEISLKQLHEEYGTPEAINAKKGNGKKVRVSGVVTRKLGTTSAYIQQTFDDDKLGLQTYGIYLYGGYNENKRLEVGYSVIVNGTIGYYNGALQISSVTTSSVKIQSYYSQSEIRIAEVDDITNYIQDDKNMCNILKVTTPLTIVDYYDAKNEKSNAITLYASYVDSQGKTQKVQLRIDNNVTLRDEEGMRIDSGAYFKGKTFKSLICVMGYYDSKDDGVHDGTVQLMITRMADIEFAE